jgi:hypothetical protein
MTGCLRVLSALGGSFFVEARCLCDLSVLRGSF